MILRRATKSVSLIPENNTKKMCFYKFVATLLLSLTHRTAKILKTNRLYQIKNILHRIFFTKYITGIALGDDGVTRGI